MIRLRRRWMPVLVATLAGVLACLPGQGVDEGEHITLITVEPALDGCGDLVGHMDRFITGTAAFLGLELGGEDFSFSWYTREHYLEDAGCPENTLGCVRGERAASYAAPHDHELVHLLMRRIGAAPSFFNEGAAVALELDTYWPSSPGRAPGSTEVLDVIASPVSIDADVYPLAGAFTRFLIDRHGLAAYLEFYASLERLDPLPRIQAVHAASFGESLEETIAVFDAERRECAETQFRFKVFECGAPLVAWDGEVLLLRRSLGCGDTDVVGPFADDSARTYVTFEVADGGVFDISVASDEPRAGAAIGDCGGCETVGAVLVGANSEPQRRYLDAGRHYVLLGADVHSAATVALRLQRVDP